MDYCTRSIGAVFSELRENDEHGNVADASPQVEAEMAHELSYTIGDEPSFTYFINELRHILSDHENSADICDGRSNEEQNHPLLSKPRADQQPSRWIRIKLLHVVKGKKQTETTTSITLVMRDDNVDVVGFINNNGAYELGYRRTMVLPAEADAEPNSSVVLLGWGNSYKSILGVRTEEEAMDRLTSANLGKAFATAAVDALSRFDPNVVADGDNPRLQVVGLMFMVSESAKLNHVHDTIARGWVNGNGFKKKLMTDHVWKYVEMSRRLRHWKGGGYAKRRPDEELRDIYLVLNEEHDLLSSDLLSFACPEMLKASFPDMMKVRFLAKVAVTLQLPRNKSQHMGRVCGKIAALIREKHRNSAYFRVGSVLCIEGNSSNPMAQASSVVAVPSGWVLHIEVDLHIKTSNSDKDMKHLKFITPMFDNDNKTGTQRSEIYEGVEVEVKITHEERADFRPQLTCPVEVKMESGYLTLVYTIGDEMSFTEFIMALRRILADHPYREELLDGHDFLNLSSSREHPVLARHRPVLGPARWLLIKLRVVEGSKTSSTTLLLRDDDLYVHGFRNDSQGDWYELRDRENSYRDQDAQFYASTSIFPTTLNPHQKLYWGVSYRSILDGSPVPRLASQALGRNFATDAVRRLSSSVHPDCWETDGLISARLALAGLILMVCESARFNPVHDFFVQGWKEGTRWRMELMEDYVWKYRDMSMDLLTWKTRGYIRQKKKKGYAARHPIREVQDIYLVLNTNRTRGGHQQLKPVAGNTGSGGGRRGPSHDDTGGGGAGKRKRVTKDGSSGSTQGHKRNKPNTAGSSGGRAADSEGSPAGRQSEESSDAGSPGESDHSEESSDDSGESDHSEESSDDSGSSGGNSSGQPGGGEADHDTQCLGRPLVELLSMRGKLGAKGTKITVFDGKRGQIIYAKEEQEREQGKMVDLLLTGPYKGISAYGCFAIVIDIPGDTAAGSSSGVAGGSIQWEWDCYDPEYAKELDQGPVTHTIGDIAEVTYAVMSNAREATVVRFKLRLKDGHTPSCVGGGKITAFIDHFEARSVLFKHGQGMGQCLSPTDDDDDGSWFLLQLARNVLAVPCRSALHIQVDLQIVTEDGNQVPLNVCLSLDNGICSSNKSKTDNGNEVQVEVTWYPEITRPDKTREEIEQPDLKLSAEDKTVFGNLVEIVHTIGDEASSFTKFIMDLRQNLAAQDHELIFELRPQLAKQQAEQPTRWIKVKLQVVEGDEMSSTTLLMRDDNLYVCGFINQYGILCKLVENKDSESFLPGGLFHPTTDLQLGVSYSSLLQAKNRDDVVRKLTAAQLSSAFAKDAVRVLSSHPDKVAGINMSIGVALAGLIFIVCESARMISVHKSIEAGWSNGKGFTEKLMEDVWNYGKMSRSLQAWKSRNYTQPHCVSELQATHLVLNSQSYKLLYDDYYTTKPLVEVLAISADLGVVGTKIIVFDGKRGQIIYRKEEQGDQGRMEDLVLTGPYRGILAGYGCFAIRIDIPATSPIIWKWDYKYAAQVNGPPLSHIICNPHDNREVAKVTYAVMSRAREATVQVKLRLNNGHSPGDISGEIVAFAHGFDFPIVLFNSAQQRTSQFFSPTADDSWILLPLARNVVAVPYRKILCIQVELQNKISKKLFKDDVYIPAGLRRRRHVVDGCEIDVNVSWYPEVNFVLPWDYPELVYTIGDDEISYTRFIMELRRIVTKHPECRNDILDNHPDPGRRSTRQHPMLADRDYLDKRWLFVKLQVAGESESTILIAIRCDDMTIHGFNNQNKDYWYSTTDESNLQKSVRVEKLNWGYRYDGILQVRTEDWGKVMDKLNSESLGKTSAVNAVRVLSRFRNRADGEADEARLAMVRLMVMISDSARMNPVHHAIAGGWNNGTEITKQLMDYIRYWDRISTALLDWKESSYSRWEKDDKLQGIGIEKEEHALEVVHLCSVVRINRSLSQWQWGRPSEGSSTPFSP